MKVKIEFECVNAAFTEDPLCMIQWVLDQSKQKVARQFHRPKASVCDAPEASDKLMDINGNTIGSVKLER